MATPFSTEGMLPRIVPLSSIPAPGDLGPYIETMEQQAVLFNQMHDAWKESEHNITFIRQSFEAELAKVHQQQHLERLQFASVLEEAARLNQHLVQVLTEVPSTHPTLCTLHSHMATQCQLHSQSLPAADSLQCAAPLRGALRSSPVTLSTPAVQVCTRPEFALAPIAPGPVEAPEQPASSYNADVCGHSSDSSHTRAAP